MAFPAQREFLTWNPSNDLATYEYKAGWMITPGCELASYRVDLACITDYELYNFDGVSCDKLQDNPNSAPMGCDCTSAAGSKIEQDKAGPSKNIYNSRRLPQGIFQDGSRRDVDESYYDLVIRYFLHSLVIVYSWYKLPQY